MEDEGSTTTMGSSGRVSPAKSPSPVKSPRREVTEVEAQAAEPAAKRARMAASTEEKARSKRMFGNILGTLRRFQDDDKSKRSSNAAKRREETSQRIAARLASETTNTAEIGETERELRALKLATENAAYVLEHREVAMQARHASLRVAGKYLHTSVVEGEPVFDASVVLFPEAPVPIARGPRKTASTDAPPLFFLPKVLLQDQEETLHARAAEIAATIEEETNSLRAAKDAHEETAASNSDKIAELNDKLDRLKDQQAAIRTGRTPATRAVEQRVSDKPERLQRQQQENDKDLDMESRPEGDEEMEVEY